MGGVILVADRDIGAYGELIALEMQRFLVLRIGRAGVMEGPPAALLALEMTDFILLSVPESDNSAKVAIRLPGLKIDPRLRIERENEDIAVSRAAFGMAFFARQFEADAAKIMRKRLMARRRMGWGVGQNAHSFLIMTILKNIAPL